MRQLRQSPWAICIVAVLTSTALAQTVRGKVATQLVGHWRVANMEVPGGEGPPEEFFKKMLIQFTDQNFTMNPQGIAASWQLEESETVNKLIMTVTDDGPFKGKKMIGFVESDGEALRLFLPNGPNGDQPPQDAKEMATFHLERLEGDALAKAVKNVRAGARRSVSINNLRQLGLALLNYESATQRFPASDTNGLSWRVHILPYLEEAALYEKFHLDEPWDSEHNKPLIEQMPNVFASPDSAGQGKTAYLSVHGDDSVIGAKNGNKIGSIKDGMSGTVMLVEAAKESAVPWTQPADFRWKNDDPRKGLREHADKGFLCLFGDGHTEHIPATVSKETIAAMFTKSGGEVYELAP